MSRRISHYSNSFFVLRPLKLRGTNSWHLDICEISLSIQIELNQVSPHNMFSVFSFIHPSTLRRSQSETCCHIYLFNHEVVEQKREKDRIEKGRFDDDIFQTFPPTVFFQPGLPCDTKNPIQCAVVLRRPFFEYVF
jgi:hypothetical protein